MRLAGEEVRQVLAGKRTAWITPPDRRQPSFEVGRSITLYVQQSEDPAAQVMVTHVSPSDLHQVDYRTMKAAGFKYREDLHSFWSETYNQDPGPPDAPVPVPVLVVRFQLDRRDIGRYMRAGPRGGVMRGDYVEATEDEIPIGVMPDEPECVPEAYQDRLSAEARERDLEERQRRIEFIKTIPLHVRLAAITELARIHEVDISRQLGIIGKRIEAIERIVHDEAA